MTAKFPRPLRLAKSFEIKKGYRLASPSLVIVSGEPQEALDVEAPGGAEVQADVWEELYVQLSPS